MITAEYPPMMAALRCSSRRMSRDFFIGNTGIDPTTGGTASIRNDHAGESLAVLLEALQDGVGSHDLDIVRMRSDAKMRGTRKRLCYRLVAGNENFR